MGIIADFRARISHGWNAFRSRAPTENLGPGSYIRPDRIQRRLTNERSIVNALYTRMAMDVAAIEIRHVRLDETGIYINDINSSLNNCLNFEANIDQTSRAFVQDLVHSLFDEGFIAIVPIDLDVDPRISTSFNIETMRVGRITAWYPKDVKVDVYNDKNGKREEILVPKRSTGIIQNPLYSIMNEPNSTLQRLIRKLNILDAIDEQSGSGKLDIIIQLPYVVKTEARQK